MEQQKKTDEEAPQARHDSRERTSKLNPTAAKILREAIITTNQGEGEGGEKEGEKAKGESEEGSSADEVLAYSRAVHHVDSSLE
jgi:hypothetical protein